MFHALAFYPNGSVMSRLEYSEEVNPLPDGQVACTEEQFNNYKDFQLVAGVITQLDSAAVLRNAKEARIAVMRLTYSTSLQGKVTFTSEAGVTELYQTDDFSAKNLSDMLLTFSSTQMTPPGFYWLSDNNTRILFTYQDLQGLAQTMGTAKLGLFQHYQGKRVEIEACTTVDAVNAVQW